MQYVDTRGGAAGLGALWYLVKHGHRDVLLAEGFERNGNNAAYAASDDLRAPSGAHYPRSVNIAATKIPVAMNRHPWFAGCQNSTTTNSGTMMMRSTVSTLGTFRLLGRGSVIGLLPPCRFLWRR